MSATINYHEIVKSIIAKVARINPDIINDTDSLRNDLNIDSLLAIQISSLIEEKFDIKIDEIEMFNVDNVNEIVDLIEEYKNNPSTAD
jgi:acyl carrier protein